jgi:beta-lactamase regulating signal transducer with metallopeptidase domain
METGTIYHVTLWVESFSQMAASSFVSGIWQGVVLAVTAGLCLRLMPKLTAAIRFAVWTAVFLVIVLLPFLHLFPAGSRSALSPPSALIQMDIRWTFAIAALWAILSLIRAVRLAISIFQLHGLWKRAIPVETGSLSLASGHGSRKAQLCTSAEVDRPSVIGFFSPRILIPVWLFKRLTPSELEQIVLHEMGHLNRADDWINLLQKIGLVLFPLNPVLMWIERRLCCEREMACDDGVLRFTKATEYASCLTNLAEGRIARRGAALSLGVWERQSELARRVHSILRRGESMTPLQARLVVGTMIFALMGGAAGLSRCPQFVGFSAGSPRAAAIEQPLSPMPVQGFPAAEYRPVVYHPSAAPHATLLKATLPPAGPRTTLRKTSVSPRKKSHPAPVQPIQHARGNSPAQGWVVLTSWEVSADGSRRSNTTLTLTDERLPMPRYAAVPTVDGWLVIQL